MTMRYGHDMDLEVRHLRLVAAVADFGSLTRASERLNVTQSALSHQLRDIEQRLGTNLFLRVGRRLVLNGAGERLLSAARDVLVRLDAAEEDVRRMGRDHGGILRITTECYTCYHWLPPLLAEYRRTQPGIDVRIEVGATGRAAPMVAEGKVDLAIVSSTVRDRRLSVRPLFEDDVVLVMAPTHRLAAHASVPIEALKGETLLIYPPRAESRVLNEVLLPGGAAPARIVEVQLTEAICELVKAGQGVSVLARWAVQPLVDARQLVARPLAARGMRRQWSAVMPLEIAKLDYVREFVSLLAEHAPTTRRGRLELSPLPTRRAARLAKL